MMENLEQLLKLPYQTLAILVGGYLAYRLAYTGRDSTHRTIDTAAIALVFAFIAQAASAWALVTYGTSYPSKANEVPLWFGYSASIAGIIFALISAAVWRRTSVSGFAWFLRKTRISSSDRHMAAWETIINKEDSGPSSIAVIRKDGSAVACERLDAFKNAPFGPMIQGQDGSIALYVTSSRAAGSENWIDADPNYADWGPEITIIPAGEVSEVRIRHNPSLLRRWRRRRGAGDGPGVVRDEDSTS
ncbi:MULTISPECIES: hypothetical protein [Sulfitobacter]|uniref:Putative membrane protein YhdT n=1 Tax=Sulfitobacter undariae TaxID=1563671 RepID=A0A7W6E5L3_9RHOB|nr:hypothetical protein [Sulfitobacter undariae]MBB3995196.1 putative membrane protein YhdT [Sulfitobacter undariae]